MKKRTESTTHDQLEAAASSLSRACEKKATATRAFEADPTDDNLTAVESADRAERACQILHAKAQRDHETALAQAAEEARATQIAELRAAEEKANYALNVEPKRKAIVARMRDTWKALRALHNEAVDLEQTYHCDRQRAIQLANDAGVESQLKRVSTDADGRPCGDPIKYDPSGGVLRESFGQSVHGTGAFWEAFDRELR